MTATLTDDDLVREAFRGKDVMRREQLRSDPRLVQRGVDDARRLHPASPVADTELSDGTRLASGDTVVLDVAAANRSEKHFGGGGPHACVGMELDGGTEDGELVGTVSVMVQAFLDHGGRRDPAESATLDASTSRKHFSAYPVLFDDGGPK